MVDSVYELQPSTRLGPAVLLAFLPLGVVLVLRRQDRVDAIGVLAVALVFGGFAAAVTHDLLWRPHRVALTASGVIFTATAREIAVPWADLTSVRRRGAGRAGRLAWERQHGRRIVTPDAFVDMHRMLTEVERRAPGVRVST